MLLFEPEHSAGELDEAHEGFGELVVSGGDAAALFDAAEEAPDPVSLGGTNPAELWNLVRDMLSDLDDAGVKLTCEDQPRIKEMKIETRTI